MTLTINNREFAVSYDSENDRYWLTGKRGAQYGTIRHQDRREMMFLVNANGRGASSVSPLGNVWLTDASGALVVKGPAV